MYYDIIPYPRELSDQRSIAFWRWCMAHTPVGKSCSMTTLSAMMQRPVKEVRQSVYGGGDLEGYSDALRALFCMGWPPACMVSDHNGGLRIFESSYIEGVERAISYGRLCRERELRDPDCDVRLRDYRLGTGSEDLPDSNCA